VENLSTLLGGAIMDNVSIAPENPWNTMKAVNAGCLQGAQTNGEGNWPGSQWATRGDEGDEGDKGDKGDNAPQVPAALHTEAPKWLFSTSRTT
jgi:hypothetical protein